MSGEEKQPAVFLIDGIAYQALEEPELDWLAPYGRVFTVWDRQFSGNLCFGVEGPYGRLFIKYAGARTVNYRGKPRSAILQLQDAMPLYQKNHPALTRLLTHGPAGEGYAAVFSWRNALPLGDGRHHQTMANRVRRLPLASSLKMLDMVFDLHAQFAMDGIIASDFHDGNVLIDFERGEALVCDVDLYRRKPAYNDRGRMRGSSRFMAPEEYELNASLDETTTEYNMAALAFAFFSENDDRSRKSWLGPHILWDVANQAVSERKADRYPSMRSFLDAWREAVGRCSLS